MATQRPLLNQLSLIARDVDAMVSFYRRLGVDVPEGHRSATDRTRHVDAKLENDFTLSFDNVELARLYNAAWRRPEGGSRTLIGFSVATRDAVDSTYADLVAAGHPGRQPPYDTFWGSRYAVVADPDGNDVGIMSPPDDGKRVWPPKESPAP